MNQLASLQKGLIFSSKLDEWGQGRDEVSGVMPTKTAVFNTQDRQGSGGTRRMEFDGGATYVELPSYSAFGTSDFSVVFNVNTKSLSAEQFIIGGATGCFALSIQTDGTVAIFRTNQAYIGSSVGTIPINTNVKVSYTRSGTTGIFYVNGITTTITDNSNYTATANRLSYYVAGAQRAFNGSISMCRIFNYALTPTQIANYSRPEYPIEWVDRGATGAELVTNGDFGSSAGWTLESGWSIGGGVASANTSGVSYIYRDCGLLTTKKYNISYQISSYTSGVFKALGSTSSRTALGTYSYTGSVTSALGYVFTDVASVGAIDNFSIKQAGCVLDLNAEGINRQNISTVSAGYWWDATNNITATVSGASVQIPSASNLGSTYFNNNTTISLISFANTPTAPLGTSARSVSLWVLPIAFKSFSWLFGYGAQSANSLWYFRLNNSTGSVIVGDYTKDAAAGSTSVVLLNQWNHVVVTYNNGIVQYYVNGVYSNSTTIASHNTTLGDLLIGSFSTTASGTNGLMSNVLLYDRVITQETVTLLYQLGH